MNDETEDARSGERVAGERIAKTMARAGLCSRREAEGWIAAGRVSVNGRRIESPALNVTARDRIEIDGAPMPGIEPTRLWRLHKTRGTVTTRTDPEGRPVLFDKLPADLPRVVSIGRLDINTEGLILLTNDGGLSRALELPSTGWLRRYRVRVHGGVDPRLVDRLAQGMTVDGVRYGAVEARIDREQGANGWLTLGLREGKNREIKRLLEAFDLRVTRLIRISFGPFQLGDLPPGEVEEVKPRILKDQLGAKLLEEHSIRLPDGRIDRAARNRGEAVPAEPETNKRGALEVEVKPSRKPSRKFKTPKTPKPGTYVKGRPVEARAFKHGGGKSGGESRAGPSERTRGAHAHRRRSS